MKNLIRLSLMGVVAASLVACGGSRLKPGKENAAAAMYQASQGASSRPGGLMDLLRQNAGTTVDVTADCPHGGSVTVHLVADTSSTTGALRFDLRYANCSYNGRTSMNGTLATEMSSTFSGTSLAAALHMTGRVDFSGEVSDFIDVNITETLDASKLAASEGASVNLVLNGTIRTSAETYTYTNETINIVAGDLQPDHS